MEGNVAARKKKKNGERVSPQREKELRYIGGIAGDKVRRAARELREAASEIIETAESLDEGAERLNTLETIIRLKGRTLIKRVAKQEFRIAALEEQMKELKKK
jgi:N-acyl-D-aspartate/D-glutamate deacylase